MNIAWFIVSFGLFVAGMWLFGAAFSDPATGIWLFTAGLAAITLSLFIPFQILGISKRHNK